MVGYAWLSYYTPSHQDGGICTGSTEMYLALFIAVLSLAAIGLNWISMADPRPAEAEEDWFDSGL